MRAGAVRSNADIATSCIDPVLRQLAPKAGYATSMSEPYAGITAQEDSRIMNGLVLVGVDRRSVADQYRTPLPELLVGSVPVELAYIGLAALRVVRI